MDERKAFTSEEFKSVCLEAIPALDMLLQVAAKHGFELVNISIGSDGYVNMTSNGFSGWELLRIGEGREYTARYSYNESIQIGKEVTTCAS